jgi:ribosome-associated translation inhibitor RaiA
MSTMKRSGETTDNPLGEYVLHVGAGFTAKDRPHVLAELATLRSHLGRWDPLNVNLEVSLQDRGRREQRVTLRTTLPGFPPLVSVAENGDISRALREAKHELVRQLEHQKSAREPMHNRKLRHDMTRRPDALA